MPWYFNKDAPFRHNGMSRNAHTIGCAYNLWTLEISISNKDAPKGGLDEWCDLPPSEEFPPGWAKSLVYRICSRGGFLKIV